MTAARQPTEMQPLVRSLERAVADIAAAMRVVQPNAPTLTWYRVREECEAEFRASLATGEPDEDRYKAAAARIDLAALEYFGETAAAILEVRAWAGNPFNFMPRSEPA